MFPSISTENFGFVKSVPTDIVLPASVPPCICEPLILPCTNNDDEPWFHRKKPVLPLNSKSPLLDRYDVQSELA